MSVCVPCVAPCDSVNTFKPINHGCVTHEQLLSGLNEVNHLTVSHFSMQEPGAGEDGVPPA